MRLRAFCRERYPLVRYGCDDRSCLPRRTRACPSIEAGQPALFQVGERAFGFSGHPGIKSAMVEDLIMEFAEAPAEPGSAAGPARRRESRIEEALVPIMTGLVRCIRSDGGARRPRSGSRRRAE